MVGNMDIGCFALIQPFTGMRKQFELIRDMGFKFADLTDNHDGATLGTEYGFSASMWSKKLALANRWSGAFS